MEFRLRVRFHELDPYGHVNHGVYLNWFETARIETMEALGFGLPTLRDRGVHLVVTEANLRFLAPVGVMEPAHFAPIFEVMERGFAAAAAEAGS